MTPPPKGCPAAARHPFSHARKGIHLQNETGKFTKIPQSLLTKPPECAIIHPSKPKTKSSSRASSDHREPQTVEKRRGRCVNGLPRAERNSRGVATDGARARYPSAAYTRMRREETVRSQVGWHRGFMRIRPEAKIIFVRGFLFGSKGRQYVPIPHERQAMVTLTASHISSIKQIQ